MAPTGRVLQVNVSSGGVPKLPVEQAWVSRMGVHGDAHSERTVHGGPHRAVCLFGIEAIERLQSEGHPVEPGSVGENLTTSGIEWSTLPVGTLARIGDTLLLELASATMPCATQKPNFVDGKFSRISIAHHPSDSRMYARVIEEGDVRGGDTIALEPPPEGSRAENERLLARLDRALAKASLIQWHAARRAGLDVSVVDDGDLAMVASPGLPGPVFNQALGLARLPNLIADATAFFAQRGVDGWLVTDGAPWPGSEPDLVWEVFAADPSAILGSESIDGLRVRRISAAETHAVLAVYRQANGAAEPAEPDPWAAVTAAMAEGPHSAVFLSEIDGRPVGAGSVHVTNRTAWLRGGTVVPEERGRGIQRALIHQRALFAVAEKCDLAGATAEIGSVSAANLRRLGFEAVGRRERHRWRSEEM